MSAPFLAVTAASGGLGASTLAAALGAALAAEGNGAVVVDLDLHGGGLDVTCGIDHRGGLRWPDLHRVRGPVEVDALVAALPSHRGSAVLSAGASRTRPSDPVPGASARADVLGSLAGGRLPVVADLPRWAVGEEMPTFSPWLLLTGTRTRELADLDALVLRVTAGRPAGQVDALALVTTGPVPDATLVAALESHLGLRHLAHVPRDRRVAAAVERGQWPGGRAFAETVHAALEWTWRRSAA